MIRGYSGTSKNADAAFLWAMKSGEHGSDSGAYLLSYMYAQGKGVSADSEKSHYWDQRGHEFAAAMQKAAQQDELQDQQQRIGIKELMELGITGLAVLSGENHNHLCDPVPFNELAFQTQELQRLNLKCEDSRAVPR